MKWHHGSRPATQGGQRIPVHIMRRFFNYLIGKCLGIEIATRGDLHSVTIHFGSGAEASGFYRALHALYDLRGPSP